MMKRCPDCDRIYSSLLDLCPHCSQRYRVQAYIDGNWKNTQEVFSSKEAAKEYYDCYIKESPTDSLRVVDEKTKTTVYNYFYIH